MKKKFAYIFTAILIISIFSYLIISLIENRKKDHLLAEKELIEITYNTVIEAFKVHSDILYFNKINTQRVKNLLKNINEVSVDEKNLIRNELYNEFIDMYTNMNSFKLKQLHFHLKNNESFLRFHRPKKFGDNLTNIRSTVEYVNKYQKKIHGFEEGRIFNGYRFVYPLSFDGNHIGSVETSVSMESIINEFRREMRNDVDFIIKKDVVDKKVFDNEKKNYKRCLSTPNFYHEISISKGGSALIEQLVLNYNKDNNISDDLAKNSTFNFFSQIGQNFYITTFFPIKNAVTNDTVGFIIVSNEQNDFLDYQNQYYIFLFILILLTMVITIVLYRLDTEKQTLKHHNEILEEVQKIGHLGYWELDLIKNKLVCSDEVYQIYELNKEKVEFKYEDFLNYVHKDDVKKVNSKFNQSIENKDSCHLEYRILTGSNKLKYVEIDIHHTLDKEGNVIQSLGTIHDITELKTYQAEIEKAKEQFESLVNHIPDVIYRCENDENYTMLYINDSIKNITGYKADELIFNRVLSFKSIIHKNDIPKLIEKIKKDIKENKKTGTVEYRIITKNNQTIWVNDTYEIINENNNLYLEGIISDITSQKEAYNKLHKFIDLQENIVILSDGKELIFANKSFFRFFRFKNLEDFKEKYNCICDFFIEDDRYFHLGKIHKKEMWIEEIRSLKNQKRIVKVLNKDSKEIIFNVTANKFENNIYIVSFNDISETMHEQLLLEEKNIRDKLTNAHNREFFDLNYENVINNARKKDKLLAIAIFDIDFFKKINDNYGHDIGDNVLIEFVSEIKKFSREEDLFIRWGGEEFLYLVEVSSQNDFYKILNHLRKLIENHHFEVVDKLTVSIGGSFYRKNEDIKDSIKRADLALYEAKRNGRNKVIIN
jgi:diguanylate cyclase (GGDEF)-like protein/PAS domain S-box-containing protein